MRRYSKQHSLILTLITLALLVSACGTPTTPSTGDGSNPSPAKGVSSFPSSTPSASPIPSAVPPSTSISQPGPAGTEPQGNEYYLDILGTSNKLSAKAWANMKEWRTKMVAFAKAHKDDVYINGPDKPRVALTFDDGPDDRTTPAVLDTLEKYKVRGSFFFLGKQAKQYPDVVKRAYDSGNLVLSHSYEHKDLTTLSTNQIHTDLKETEDVLAQITGKKPAILRTPYGETDDKVVSAAKKDGYSIVLWSIDTLDWSQKERDNIVKNVISNVRNGDIILMHSSKEQAVSAEALPIIIEQLQKKGFQIVDLHTLLGIKAYKE